METPISDSSFLSPHNSNANKHGTTPLQLMTGKNATFPGITERSSNQEASEYVLQMLRCQETFRKAEYASKIKEAENAAYIPSYHDEFYDENDWVFVQEHDNKGAWSGPYKVVKHVGNEVVIDKNGDYGTTRLHPSKVARAKFEPKPIKLKCAFGETNSKCAVGETDPKCGLDKTDPSVRLSLQISILF